MNYIFHTFTIAFIIYELLWLLNPKHYVELAKKFSEESEKHKGLKWEDFSDEYKGILPAKLVKVFVFTGWMFLGLLSFNWVVFLSLIIFNLIVIAPISKVTKYSKIYTGVHWVNSLIGFSAGIFILVNSFHLKINLYNLIVGLF